MADVRQTKLGDLFSSSVFHIPRYQRGYAWSEKEVRDLLEDIEYSYEERVAEGDNNFTHYFGTIVMLDRGTENAEADDYSKYDLIDGQQRMTTVAILMNCINEQLNSIDEGKLSGESDSSMPPGKLASRNRDDFILSINTERIVLDDINDQVFKALVVHNRELDSINTETVSQRRLVRAKREIWDWLENKREQYIHNDSHDEYYNFLKEIQKIVKTGLEITQYTVEDETESGRLFEVINDRGKALTNLDKIKSYLVYCSARFNDNDLSIEIYQTIGEVIENITKYGGEDRDIETFVRYHWMLFSGELVLARQSNSEYTTVHRRIKHLEKHASLNQGEEDVRAWIDAYLESLVQCSEAYLQIKHPDEINSDYNSEEEVVEDLDGLNRLPVSNNFLPLLMATHHRYGISDEFRRIVSLCEKLSFRVYNVAGRRTDAGRAALQRHGYWIEYAGRSEVAGRIFHDQQAALKFDTVEESIPETCKRIESEIGDNSPDTYFMDCLLRTDLFDGTDRNDGWTGVRDSDVIRYLLYKYEKYLRMDSSRDDLSQIPPFSVWKQEGITIEHIHPQTSDNDESELDRITNTLGNLVLLGPRDNSGASNMDYEDKYEDTYSKSSMMMIDELPSPEEGWSADKAKERANKIMKFARQEWGGLSTAHVHVNQLPEESEITPLALRDVAHDVREYHEDVSSDGFTIPSVVFQREGARGSDWRRMNDCYECESTVVNLLSLDGWEAECRGCSTELDDPVYKFQESDYIKT
ncbi:DUF262 domain-containing HNH endonuclease family protein [Halorussus gelatinilyticus]|uniref:DUF262 domain-containing HNH endonuclease family protein n=1 Tax=Halorussus gelatinilyticus TaxID=2937524 RepID=A0A8U0IN81_9EURY|nr:DUF262 domain-containing protein [Halorussus gelatinilyticus]UPW01634.1 DUF262 domain-containing HNH endonuclease family protein [Halorussus gelatinilyticus]